MIRLSQIAMMLLVVGFATQAPAEHRAALVVGNGAYPGAELASPVSDAAAVRGALEKRGFVVTTIENADAKTLQAGVEKFVHSVPTCGTALVYFSGYALHGGQNFYADNFLMPVDGDCTNTGVVPQGKVGVRWLLEQLRTLSGSTTNVLLVDGSYAHPKQAKQQDFTLRKIERFPEESLVVYAAPFGEVTAPAMSGLSPIAKRLVDELGSSRRLHDVLAEVGAARESSLSGREALTEEPSRAIAPPSQLKAGTKAGDEWVNPWGMVFCWCPAGSFTMGSPTNEAGRDEEETERRVTFKQGFWIAKYEFTRREIMTLMKRHTYLSTGTHKLQPLDKTRKDDVGQWLAMLNAGPTLSGWRYAVPTEQEWEYAARAGSTSAYHFGGDVRELPHYANLADVTLYETDGGYYGYAERSLNDGSALIAKVGSYRPNAWGLHDVCGNLSEHCDTPYENSKIKPGNYPNHVIRGGSWLSMPSSCRSAARNYYSFGASENVVPNHVGYRLMIRPQ